MLANFEDYKLALTEPATLVTSPVYELTIPLAAPASAKEINPNRGRISLNNEATVMLRLSRLELDLIADLILQERSKNQYG